MIKPHVCVCIFLLLPALPGDEEETGGGRVEESGGEKGGLETAGEW